MNLMRLTNGKEAATGDTATATSATDDGPIVALRLLATGDVVSMPLWVARECTTLKDLLDDTNGTVTEIPIMAPTSAEAPTVDDPETIEWIVRFARAAKTADETAKAASTNLEKRTAIALRDADVQMPVFQELDEADERADQAYAAQHNGSAPETPHRRLLNLMVSANYLNYERAKRAAARHTAILTEHVTKDVTPEEGGVAIRKLLMPYAQPPKAE